MTSYDPFFSGSATVAGALIGLLFVALSISPDRLRDSRSVEHQAIAGTAFTALVDALFISLIGLQPGGGLQYGAVILGALGLSSTFGLALRLWRSRHLGHLSNRWPYFLGVIMALYAAQLITGLLPETAAGAANQTVTFVYGMFGVGIARSWQLLGLKGGGLLDELGVTLSPPPRAALVGRSAEGVGRRRPAVTAVRDRAAARGERRRPLRRERKPGPGIPGTGHLRWL